MRLLPLVIILLCAGLLLMDELATRAIWVDEGYSITASQQATLSDILTFIERDNHPPLYPIVLHGWGRVMGAHPAALRMLGVFATLLTLAITYRLGLDWFTPRTALAAMLLTATSDLLIGMTPLARQYNLYMLLAALSIWCYWRYTRRWQWGWGLAYTLVSVALLYTLYWGAFILIAQGVHFLLVHPRRVIRLAIPAALIALAYLPWLPRLQQTLSGSGYTMSASGHLSALAVDREGVAIILYQLFGLPEALFLGLTVAGIVACYPTRWRPDARTGLAALWLSLPILLPALITLAGYRMLTHFPMLGLIPAMALLIGHVLGQMERWIYTLLLGILLVNNLTTTGADFRERGPWWAVADTLAAYSNPATAVLMESDYHAYVLQEHMQIADVPAAGVIRAQQIRDRWSGEPAVEVNDLIAAQAAVWLFEFIPARDLRPDLQSLGYQPTTPPLDYGVFLGRPITLQRFALPLNHEPLAVFGDHLHLLAAPTFQQDHTLSVDLTWTVPTVPGIDYTVSVFLLHPNGTLAAQHDSFPLDGKAPTGGWQPGQFYFDPHNLPLAGLAPGSYTLAIKVYTWQDGAVQPVSPCDVPDCQYFVVGRIDL